jgi:hypothetical protein
MLKLLYPAVIATVGYNFMEFPEYDQMDIDYLISDPNEMTRKDCFVVSVPKDRIGKAETFCINQYGEMSSTRWWSAPYLRIDKDNSSVLIQEYEFVFRDKNEAIQFKMAF